MKFRIDSDNIKGAVKVIPDGKRLSYNVTIEANKDPDCVTLEGADGKMEIKISIPAHVEQPGEATIDATDMITFMETEGEIVVSLKAKGASGRVPAEERGKELHITDSRNVKHRLQILKVRHKLPVRPSPKGSVTMSLKNIKELFSRVLWATECEIPTASIGCIKLECGNQMVAIASNGRVGAVARTNQGSPYTGSFQLATEAVRAILKLNGDLVTLEFAERGIGFAVSSNVTYDLYIPEYAHLFPDVLRFLDILDRSSITGNKKDFLIATEAVRFSGDELVITLNRLGGYEEQPVRFSAREKRYSECQAKGLSWEGEDIKIRTNRLSLLKAIQNASPDSEIKITMTNDLLPFRVENIDGQYICGIPVYSPGERR